VRCYRTFDLGIVGGNSGKKSVKSYKIIVGDQNGLNKFLKGYFLKYTITGIIKIINARFPNKTISNINKSEILIIEAATTKNIIKAENII